MTLTKDQMQAAHFARQIDLDPDYQIRGEARARAIARELDTEINPSIEDKYAAQYNLGATTLATHTLTYSARFSVLPPDVSADVTDYITVDSGHIATSPAYRLAMFKLRKLAPPQPGR